MRSSTRIHIGSPSLFRTPHHSQQKQKGIHPCNLNFSNLQSNDRVTVLLRPQTFTCCIRTFRLETHRPRTRLAQVPYYDRIHSFYTVKNYPGATLLRRKIGAQAVTVWNSTGRSHLVEVEEPLDGTRFGSILWLSVPSVEVTQMTASVTLGSG